MRKTFVARLTLITALAAAAALALPAGALAGRLIVTGHDADFHCGGSDQQCHWVKVAVDHVRGGAPDPSKPVLVLDRGDLDAVRALDKAYPPGSVPRTVVDPRTPAFASAAINTASFSAIIVASDTTCGGCDLNDFSATLDSDAINARKADIEAFYNAGGGVLALAGGNHGDGNATNGADVFYGFVPVPVGGVAVSAPFTLTADGRALGFEDSTKGIGTNDDINCCPTHNSFSLPAAGGALKVAETDSKGSAETLFAQGSISGGSLVDKPSAVKPSDVIKLPSSKRCVSRRRFRIRLRQPGGIRIEQAIVFVNRKRVRVVKRKRVTAPVDLTGLPKGRFTVKITVITTTGRIITGQRRYRTCTPKRRGPGKPRI